MKTLYTIYFALWFDVSWTVTFRNGVDSSPVFGELAGSNLILPRQHQSLWVADQRQLSQTAVQYSCPCLCI